MRNNNFSRLAVIAFAMAAATQAIAGPCPANRADEKEIAARVERMDTYFMDARSPVVFRALSGMGDPRLENAYDDRWQWRDGEEKALMDRLYPGASKSDLTVYPGHCRVDAPLAVLRERIAKLGAGHPYVAQWIAAQHAVLAVCAVGSRTPVESALPAPLATSDPAIARMQTDDRAYQQATLLFYEGQAQAALDAFARIAADRASINRPNAAYMAMVIRAGSTPGGYERKPLVTTGQSLQDIAAILADPSLASIHAIAAAIIGWIGANEADMPSRRAQVHEALLALEAPLEQLKASELARRRYTVALDDIVRLHSDFPDPAWWLDGAVPTDHTASRAIAEAAPTDPLAAWLLFPANPYFRHPWAAVAMYQRLPSDLQAYIQKNGEAEASPASNPWRHEAAWRAGLFTEPSLDLASAVEDEIARVQGCDLDDAALAALPFDFYHLERQLWTRGGGQYSNDRAKPFNDALRRLHDFPFKASAAYRAALHDSLQYLITEGYLAMARKLRDDLALDAGGDDTSRADLSGMLVVLAEDETRLVRALNVRYFPAPEFLNGLSISELWRLAARPDVGNELRARCARTAWTRAYALGRTIPWRADLMMRLLNPEITGSWHSPAGRDVTPDDRLVLADVLASPGLNMLMEPYARAAGQSDEVGLTHIDHENHNDNNWWCAWELDRHARDLDDTLRYTFGDLEAQTNTMGVDPLNYGEMIVRQALNPAIRESFVFRHIDRAELVALSNVECAPKLLTARVIAWVKDADAPRDGLDEALANAVATSRWGCARDGSHAAYSRRAFALLHQKFPNSTAAKRTRYWFACPLHDTCKPEDPLTSRSVH